MLVLVLLLAINLPSIVLEHLAVFFHLCADVKKFFWDAADVDTCASQTPCISLIAWTNVIEEGDRQAEGLGFLRRAKSTRATAYDYHIIHMVLFER